MSNKTKLIYPIILLITCLLFSISAVLWINRDGGFTFTSDAAHLFNASEHFRNLKAPDITDFLLTREMYPNLVHQLTSFTALITGDVLKAFVLVNLFFVVLLAFGVYFTGSLIWDENTGLIAALLSLSLPGIVLFSRINNIDIATAAAVIWALYFLIKSDRFRNKTMTAAFFAACAAGMLTKWAFAFFLLVPFIVEIIPWKNEEDGGSWKDPAVFVLMLGVLYAIPLIIVNFLGKDELGFPPIDAFWIFHIIFTLLLTVALITLMYLFKSQSSPLKNMSQGLLLFMLLTNHYYLFSFQYLAKTYLGRFWGKELKEHAFNHNFYTFFVRFFTLDIMGIPVVLLSAVGIIYYLVKAKKTEGANLLLWSAGSGLLFLALQPLYINRYYLPLAGAMTLFSAFWIPRIPWKPVRALILIPLLSIGFLSWSGWMFLPPAVNKIFPEIPVEKPVKATWQIKDTVDFLWEDQKKHSKNSGRSFFIFHNESPAAVIKPLVMMFCFSENMNADDKIFFFPEDINLREEIRDTPVMYYIVSENEDKSDDEGAERHGYNDNGQRHGNEADWNVIKPALLYYIHFAVKNSEKEENQGDNTPEKRIEAYLKPQWIQALQNKQLLRTTDIPESLDDGCIEKADRKFQIYIYKIELNQ